MAYTSGQGQGPHRGAAGAPLQRGGDPAGAAGQAAGPRPRAAAVQVGAQGVVRGGAQGVVRARHQAAVSAGGWV